MSTFLDDNRGKEMQKMFESWLCPLDTEPVTVLLWLVVRNWVILAALSVPTGQNNEFPA